MKKAFTYSMLSLIAINAASAATPWWQQPTVCRLNPTECYKAMGAGYDAEMWDATGNCWGLKLICPSALTRATDKPVAMGRADIKSGNGINPDYDTDMLSTDGDCFGRRKTGKDGTTVSVNGKYVNIYCPGILSKPDEILSNGEIMYTNQPTCKSLADMGYVAVENDNCYGKYFDLSKYYIDCGTSLLPTRLIALNGADYNAPNNGGPTTMDAAKQMFNQMYNTSREQKEKYYNK